MPPGGETRWNHTFSLLTSLLMRRQIAAGLVIFVIMVVALAAFGLQPAQATRAVSASPTGATLAVASAPLITPGLHAQDAQDAVNFALPSSRQNGLAYPNQAPFGHGDNQADQLRDPG